MSKCLKCIYPFSVSKSFSVRPAADDNYKNELINNFKEFKRKINLKAHFTRTSSYQPIKLQKNI